ncbi:hypothetical protein GW17_00049368 [Ensete ventricosum]|nr:hypothetical protein GW17_00049368 [Ensete ventricosum]
MHFITNPMLGLRLATSPMLELRLAASPIPELHLVAISYVAQPVQCLSYAAQPVLCPRRLGGASSLSWKTSTKSQGAASFPRGKMRRRLVPV